MMKNYIYNRCKRILLCISIGCLLITPCGEVSAQIEGAIQAEQDTVMPEYPEDGIMGTPAPYMGEYEEIPPADTDDEYYDAITEEPETEEPEEEIIVKEIHPVAPDPDPIIIDITPIIEDTGLVVGCTIHYDDGTTESQMGDEAAEAYWNWDVDENGIPDEPEYEPNEPITEEPSAVPDPIIIDITPIIEDTGLVVGCTIHYDDGTTESQMGDEAVENYWNWEDYEDQAIDPAITGDVDDDGVIHYDPDLETNPDDDTTEDPLPII